MCVVTRLHYKDTLSAAKYEFYSHLIESGESNNKVLFSTVNRFLKPPDSFPAHLYCTARCDESISFFSDKISAIHQHLASSANPYFNPLHSVSTDIPLLFFFTLPSGLDISK